MAMHHLNVIVTLLGGLVLVLGLVSRRLDSSILPPSVLALAVGIAIGPAGLQVIDPGDFGDSLRVVESIARLTLGIGLVGVALRVPRCFPRKHARELGILLVAGMVLMWAVSTALVHLVLGLPLALAAVIGAIVTPTDPIAATPVVAGRLAERLVAARVRHLVSFESGANDGLAYLFVFLPAFLMLLPLDRALHEWLVDTLLWDVAFATAFGLVLGAGAGVALRFAERRDWIGEKWRLVYTAALALVATGGGRLIGSDELLVAFAAGAAFVQVVSADDRKNEEQGQEAINRFFAIPFFVVLGTALPWDGWARMGVHGPLLAIAILLLRRPLPLLLMRPVLPSLTGHADALFMGWFGPIAVAAVYYATVLTHDLGEPRIWEIVSLVVFTSTLAHGMTAAPFTRWYGRSRERPAAEQGCA